MAFPEYQLRQYMKIGWIREQDQKAEWIFGTRKRASSALSLEDHIYLLRSELENLVQSGKDLTSPEVVNISMQLDLKINASSL